MIPAGVVRVTSASESAALDAAAIAGGTPSRMLMERAGMAAAGEIVRRYTAELAQGVHIFAGAGNNGGDGWVVARALASEGVQVRVTESGEPRTDDAAHERGLALPFVVRGEEQGAALLVDALLGTGSSGAPRGRVAELINAVRRGRERGARIISLDVPSGIDGSTGEAHDPAVAAHLTLSLGTLKRGLLRARDQAGDIAVLDIGLPKTEGDGTPILVTAELVRQSLPVLAAAAHKGTRRKIAIIGGAAGMAGAVALASRAALRSGVGMVRVLVAAESLAPIQGSVHEVLADAWPTGEGAKETLGELVGEWADGLLIGPGLGRSREARRLVDAALKVWRGPVVLDADALNVFKGEADALAELLGGRPALITPHVVEFARLAELPSEEVQRRHFDVGHELASRLGASVLLKGVPTVITSPRGSRLVSASGTPALAAAGSGDVLAGIAATLLAQLEDPLLAGGCAAWVHGRAAEIAGAGRPLRGVALSDVVDALGLSWPGARTETPAHPVLAELPSPVEGW